MLPKLTGVKYHMVIDASSGYHYFKRNEQLSYVTFFCPFGRHLYLRLSLGEALVDNMLQKKIGNFFSDIPNIFGIADDILIADVNAL